MNSVNLKITMNNIDNLDSDMARNSGATQEKP
jgi:hypothetical protein